MDIETLAARVEIVDVLAGYTRGVDRGDWDLVRSCYHPDATDDHGLYSGGVAGLLEFLENLAATLSSTTHQLGQILVEADLPNDTARSEAYCLGVYHRQARSGATRMIMQGVRYLDVFERRSSHWAISNRTVVLDWEQTLEASDEASIASSWQRGGRGASDPSFRPRRAPTVA